MGILFDFNGVLFEDSHFHELAWFQLAKREFGIILNASDMSSYIHGRQNKDILNFLSNNSLGFDELIELSKKKESHYRTLCMEFTNISLVDGAVAMFEELKINEIPFTIVSSTDQANISFYFEIFELFKWFDLAKIVYSNDEIKGKPAPDSYLIGANNIQVPISQCYVIEDSKQGIIAAKVAKAKGIVALGPEKNFGEYMNLGATACLQKFGDICLEELGISLM